MLHLLFFAAPLPRSSPPLSSFNSFNRCFPGAISAATCCAIPTHGFLAPLSRHIHCVVATHLSTSSPLGRHIRCAISTSVFLSTPFVATSWIVWTHILCPCAQYQTAATRPSGGGGVGGGDSPPSPQHYRFKHFFLKYLAQLCVFLNLSNLLNAVLKLWKSFKTWFKDLVDVLNDVFKSLANF